MSILIDMTMAEIEEKHDGQFIWSNDAGLVWDTEAESENDDGAKAVARYLIRYAE